jgi:hypothetical protein
MGSLKRQPLQRMDQPQEGELTCCGGRAAFPTRSECLVAFSVRGGAGCPERECGQDRPEFVHRAREDAAGEWLTPERPRGSRQMPRQIQIRVKCILREMVFENIGHF